VLRTNGARRVVEEPSATAERTILIVEDSEPIRRILTLLLEGHGYQVVAVERGEAGLTLARERHPQAITIDLALPDMDGRALLRELKLDARTCTIPVIVISAYASTLSAAERVCAAEVLSKPFDVDELLTRVARVVG
jgi:CheY-like chemotaxis protein